MMLKNNLKALAMGFNNEKYWSRRDKIFDLKHIAYRRRL